jgi:hypothetical protein
MPFGKLPPQSMLKMALHSRGADAFAAAQPAAIDSIQVLLKDRFSKGLARSLAGQDTRQSLARLLAAA